MQINTVKPAVQQNNLKNPIYSEIHALMRLTAPRYFFIFFEIVKASEGEIDNNKRAL